MMSGDDWPAKVIDDWGDGRDDGQAKNYIP